MENGYETQNTQSEKDFFNDIAGEVIKKFGKKRFEKECILENGEKSTVIEISFEDNKDVEDFFMEKMNEKLSIKGNKGIETRAYGGSISGGNTLLGAWAFPQYFQIANAPGVYNVYSSPSSTTVSDYMYDKEIFVVLGVDGSQTNNTKIYYMSSSGAMKEAYTRTGQYAGSAGFNPWVGNLHFHGIVEITGIYRPYWTIRKTTQIFNTGMSSVDSLPVGSNVAGTWGATASGNSKNYLQVCAYRKTYNGAWITTNSSNIVPTGINIDPDSPIIGGKFGGY